MGSISFHVVICFECNSDVDNDKKLSEMVPANMSLATFLTVLFHLRCVMKSSIVSYGPFSYGGQLPPVLSSLYIISSWGCFGKLC